MDIQLLDTVVEKLFQRFIPHIEGINIEHTPKSRLRKGHQNLILYSF
jgi:hypothetical protein